SIFTFRAPNYMGSPYSLLLPFSNSIWLSILAITTIISILMTISQFYSYSKKSDKTFSGSVITVVGTFFQQGFSYTSSRLSERILLITTLISGMLICFHFSSMIVTVLIRPVPISIVTAEDLAASKLKIAVHNIPYFHTYFKDTKNTYIREFYRKKMKNQHEYVAIPVGVELMRTAGYAFYTEESYQYPSISNTFTDSEICTVSDVELVKPYMVPSPMRKNTPYRKHVNCGLLLMKEVGILARETNQWRTTQPKCQGSIDYSSVHFESLTVAYIVYLTGLILSIVILFVENYIYKKRKELLEQ
ncbi:hypothetical protein LSTR_LSTR017204, partial [Laodelphax striatellus]